MGYTYHDGGKEYTNKGIAQAFMPDNKLSKMDFCKRKLQSSTLCLPHKMY